MTFVRILFLSLLFPVLASSQSWEVGIMVGTCNYLGDIGNGAGPNRPFIYDLQLNKTKPGLGIFLRYHASYRLGIRANLMYGQATGDDVLTENQARRERNLHFKSNVTEFSTQIEWAFYKSKHAKYRNLNQSFDRTIVISEFTAFGFAGLGVFKFNPKTLYQGNWVELQPLGTEGQLDNCPSGSDPGCKKKYRRVQLNIPMGVGIHYHINKQLRVGVEVGWRKLFTDYLDDISTFYPDTNLLKLNNPGNERMAVDVTFRTAEITSDPVSLLQYVPGSKRGDGSAVENDSYFFTVVTFSYFLDFSFPKGIDCPKYKSQKFLIF